MSRQKKTPEREREGKKKKKKIKNEKKKKEKVVFGALVYDIVGCQAI